MSLNNKITIVTACDNHYVVLLAALIKSVEVTNRSASFIDFYVVDDHISERNKEKIKESVSGDRLRIIWKKLSEVIPEGMKLPVDKSTFPLNTYSRLFIPYFIDPEIEKVIYLDVDMIVMTDIAGLWNIPMGDHIIAGVRDRAPVVSHWMGIVNYRELGLAPETKYFNAGLLMIRPAEWRKNDIPVKILDCIRQNSEYTHYADQYGLNVVFAGEWLEIDPRWNCFADSAVKDPFLIHFIVTKPIYSSYNFNQEYKEFFYTYLGLTQWKDYRPKSDTAEVLKKLKKKVIRKFLRAIK